MNFNEVSFSDDSKYKVLELNSFCIKPENEEEKIDIKKNKEVGKRQNEKKIILIYKILKMKWILYFL